MWSFESLVEAQASVRVSAKLLLSSVRSLSDFCAGFCENFKFLGGLLQALYKNEQKTSRGLSKALSSMRASVASVKTSVGFL